MRRRWVLGLALAAGTAWVAVSAPRGGVPNGEVQGRVLEAVRVSGRAAPLAGISARGRVEVKAISGRRIGADTASPEYHRYLNRCGACHAAPAPDLHPAAEWPAVIGRMHANMRSAGTLGLQEADRAAVQRFLARHGRR